MRAQLPAARTHAAHTFITGESADMAVTPQIEHLRGKKALFRVCVSLALEGFRPGSCHATPVTATDATQLVAVHSGSVGHVVGEGQEEESAKKRRRRRRRHAPRCDKGRHARRQAELVANPRNHCQSGPDGNQHAWNAYQARRHHVHCTVRWQERERGRVAEQERATASRARQSLLRARQLSASVPQRLCHCLRPPSRSPRPRRKEQSAGRAKDTARNARGGPELGADAHDASLQDERRDTHRDIHREDLSLAPMHTMPACKTSVFETCRPARHSAYRACSCVAFESSVLVCCVSVARAWASMA